METLTTELENHFINFMMNEFNSNTLMFKKLWEIEFNEGGKVTLEFGEVWVSGDNGRVSMSELTFKNLTNK